MNKDFVQIQQTIHKKIYSPLYFLYGEESFYIDQIVDAIEKNAIEDHEKAFNQTIVYGREVKVEQVIEHCRRLPMMANHQVVIVKEAQGLKNIEQFQSYIDHPTPSTILVIAYKQKSVDKRKKIFKSIIQHTDFVSLESKAIREYEIEKWIASYCSTKKVQIDSKGIQLLAECLGTDLTKIANAIDKLLINKPDGNISVSDIEENVGVNREYTIFELNNALGKKDRTNAYRIVNYFSKYPKTFVYQMAVGLIFGFYLKLYLCKFYSGSDNKELAVVLKLHPFIVKEYRRHASRYATQEIEQIFSILAVYDAKSKGIGNASTKEGELLKEMVARIFSLSTAKRNPVFSHSMQ